MLSELGQVQIWNGPHCPWHWARILLLENRLEDLRKTAAYDPEKLQPPKDLWPLARQQELEDWLEARSKLREAKLKEKKPLDA